ncbi:sigma-54-dependent Fis family transcriptional regulator [Anoxybacter fermentans]|uniref:Sigma-54-dependent Fis family transcriptional regulator n=1 Tax=Anoxybacter fermentans TaxID=1323375 RepID=A0A3Q9HQN4_9FIRM|nr:sigma-54-dependent Fis family transcriptional regulator [Anoxybacter fermentans]AZR73449.1 sigma-54-dependent Fis family transcriptional regulator [Anoxybacter fermentans]
MLKILIVGLKEAGKSIIKRISQLNQVKILGVLSLDSDFISDPDLHNLAIPIIQDLSDGKMDKPDLVIDTLNLSREKLGEILGKDIIEDCSILSASAVELLNSLIEDEEDLLRRLKRVNREKDVIINSTHDGMIAINSDGIITLFNQAAEKIMNLKAVECVGRYVEEVIPNSRLHLVLKTGKEELNQTQAIGNTTIITNRVPVRDHEGNIIGAVAVFRDITEVKSLAEELTNLKEMRVMLEAIIESTQDAISVVDEKGMGILINPAYTRLTGLTEEDVIGKPATVDIAEGESMHMKVLKTKKPVSGVRLKVGPKKKEVIVNVAPIIVDGKLKGSVGVIHDISEIKKLTEELNQARRMIRHLNAKYTFEDIIAESKLMLAAIQQARRASKTPATVLLRGESGTGKELFAHAIHNSSPRKDGQFIRVNCSAIADSLLESELFGYEEGAFTGARKGGKKGLFEEADGGTIFLDEIGKINLELQAKLLRVLQEKEVIRVGGTKAISVDVRVIVATNANLERMIQEGTFREDLYYRLNVVPIFIPPLRKRKEDIPKLTYHLIRKFNQEYGRSIKNISKGALDILMDYDWPGNVRELENIIGRAIINVGFDSDIITEEHLPPLGMLSSMTRPEKKETKAGYQVSEYDIQNKSLKEILDEVEKEVILEALDHTGGNKTEAAKLLGIAIRSLYYKLEKYGIQ